MIALGFEPNECGPGFVRNDDRFRVHVLPTDNGYTLTVSIWAAETAKLPKEIENVESTIAKLKRDVAEYVYYAPREERKPLCL